MVSAMLRNRAIVVEVLDSAPGKLAPAASRADAAIILPSKEPSPLATKHLTLGSTLEHGMGAPSTGDTSR